MSCLARGHTEGSYVGPEKLTFDFNSAALTPSQVRDIERLVNERILEKRRSQLERRGLRRREKIAPT